MRLSVHYRVLPSEIQRRVSSREFALLHAYYQIRPFGDETGLLAALCAISCNATGATKKDGNAFEADDFLPGERPLREIEHEFQDAEETIANLKSILAPFRK